MRQLGLILAMAVAFGASSPQAACAEKPVADAASTQPPVVRIRTGSDAFDIEARERQVASGDQRIAPLAPAELTGEAKQIYESVKAFFGSKEEGVPNTIVTMAKHPGLYRGQMQLGLELNQHGKLPPRERELAILRTAWLVRSPFEWGEHVAYGKRLGLTSEDIERITKGSSAPGWSDHDRAILRAVEELQGDFAISDETWAILAKTWSEPQLLELPGIVGSYTMTAMIYNSVRFGLLKGNPGFSAR